MALELQDLGEARVLTVPMTRRKRHQNHGSGLVVGGYVRYVPVLMLVVVHPPGPDCGSGVGVALVVWPGICPHKIEGGIEGL